MRYYAVFNTVRKEPDAIFKTRRWAENFIRNQKSFQIKIKYSIWEVEIPRTSRKKLTLSRQEHWYGYLLQGIKILFNNLRNK